VTAVRKTWRVLAAFAAAGWATLDAPGVAGATETWTALMNQPPRSIDTCELLTDGTVMCHEASSAHWHRLSPDPLGSYVDGAWDSPPIADMPNVAVNDGDAGCASCPYAPLYFASAVLADGRVVVAGGEYLVTPAGSVPVWSNLGFLYDPVANAWSGPFTGGFPSGSVGDAMGVVLPDGGFVLQEITTSNLELLDPTTLSFRVLNPPGKKDINDEENLNLLPSGSLLTVESNSASASEIFDPSSNRWGNVSATPVNLVDSDTTAPDGGSHQPTFELGPAVMRPDGTLVYFTGNLSGRNALYDVSSGTWSAVANGNFPSGVAVQDGPASLLPDGTVLVIASPGQSGPSHFYEFTLGTNVLQSTSDASGVARVAPYETRMILLPTGEVLLTGVSLSAQTYSNGGQPNAAWRPTITSAPAQINPGTTYGVAGQQLNGFSEGAFYGDDAQSSTNYPLVRITNVASGHVRYARTHDHSRMGIESIGSTEAISTQFDAPAGLELGPSTLVVVVNGIASASVNVTVGSANVPATQWYRTLGLCVALSLLGTRAARRRLAPSRRS
jgi:hypothetical protein